MSIADKFSEGYRDPEVALREQVEAEARAATSTLEIKPRKLTQLCPIVMRPACEFCGRKLKPATSRLWVPKDQPAAIGMRLFGGEILTQGVIDAAIKVTRNVNGTINTVDFWTPAQGYQGVRGLFCTHACAEAFGLAAYKAGYRIVRKPGGLPSSEPGTGKG